MEQRTASKQVPTALISCQIFTGPTRLAEAYFIYRNLLPSFIFEKYLLYLLLFGHEREELKGKG